MKNSEEKQLIKLIKKEKPMKYFILDDKNGIGIFKKGPNYVGEFIHYRLNNNVLEEVKKFESSILLDNYISIIPGTTDLVRICNGGVRAIYNYKTAQFIVPEGIWHNIYYGEEILSSFQGILVYLDIDSDTYSFAYNNAVYDAMFHDLEKQNFNFQERYYAIINFDGTIRANKLFKGESFHKITEIIDLNNYSSLQEFIEERKQICNEQAKGKRDEFINRLNKGSPYIDKEVVQVLNLKKRMDK